MSKPARLIQVFLGISVVILFCALVFIYYADQHILHKSVSPDGKFQAELISHHATIFLFDGWLVTLHCSRHNGERIFSKRVTSSDNEAEIPDFRILWGFASIRVESENEALVFGVPLDS